MPAPARGARCHDRFAAAVLLVSLLVVTEWRSSVWRKSRLAVWQWSVRRRDPPLPCATSCVQRNQPVWFLQHPTLGVAGTGHGSRNAPCNGRSARLRYSRRYSRASTQCALTPVVMSCYVRGVRCARVGLIGRRLRPCEANSTLLDALTRRLPDTPNAPTLWTLAVHRQTDTQNILD